MLTSKILADDTFAQQLLAGWASAGGGTFILAQNYGWTIENSHSSH